MASTRGQPPARGLAHFAYIPPTTTTQGSYEFQVDPWHPNGTPASAAPSPHSHLVFDADARGSRPLTWGGYSVGSADTSPVAAKPHDPSRPLSFYQAWRNACSNGVIASSTDHDADAAEISLGQLHRLLTVAGELSVGAAEKIVNICCTGSRCSRYDFYLALVLLRQTQDGQPLDLQNATSRLQSGSVDVDKSPRLNLDAIAGPAPTSAAASHVDHTFPPPNAASVLAPRPPGPMREMSDPWNTSSIGTANGNGYGTYRDDLPTASSSAAAATPHGPASRGYAFSGIGERDAATGKGKQQAATNGAGLAVPPTSNPANGVSSATSLGISGSSRLPTGAGTASRRDRPSSYVSDSAEANAVGGADDPEADLPVDEMTVRLRSELEGFLIKHNVYVVSSALRQTSVVRRYSDWVWLAECLVKRYPFRCLPLLPPKRISLPVAGRHLSGEDQFIERRRRGLERYLRVMCSHPVLRQDRLVEIFFVEKKALSDASQTAPPLYLEEEGLTEPLDEVEAMSIPEDLDAKLAQQRRAIPALLERWTSTVTIFERMVRRSDAAAADMSRFNFTLLSLVESSGKRWRPESDVRSKETEGCLTRVAEAFQDASDLLSRRAVGEGGTTLERLKHQRDLVCSFRDLFVRLDRLLPDQVEALRRKVELGTKRAVQIKREEKARWQKDYERIVDQVNKDGEMVERLLARRLHVRKTVWKELVWFHWRYREVEEVWKAWTREEGVYEDLSRRNWEVLGLKLDM